MHVILLAPHFPANQLSFARGLKAVGARVTGIIDSPRHAVPSQALALLDDAEIRLGKTPWIAATQQWALLAQGSYEEALALAPEVRNEVSFFGMSAEPLPLAMSGDIDAARAAMEAWQAKNGRNLRSEIEIHAAIGDREGANELAAELDAKPGGFLVLMLGVNYCACGAPFDLEATPVFRERIKESGLDWPPEPLMRYPAKDW